LYLVRPSYLIKQLYPNAIWRKSGEHPFLYLTFDDGPIPELTPWVLDILKQYNVAATFFCVGDNIKKHPTIYQRILQEKHVVGNHTFNHMDGWKNTVDNYLENVDLCHEAMSQDNEFNLFRPPYGKLKKSQSKQLLQQYSIIMWDVLTGDYDKNTSPEQCLNNAISYVRNGSIVVFHDNLKAQLNLQYALPRFIEHALSCGFQFKTLS
jgi:peptidoglycan/xylan/chitin deacetylase (PgdA/CDA1 family)